MENGCTPFSLAFQEGLFEEETFELGDLSNEKEPTMLGIVFPMEGTKCESSGENSLGQYNQGPPCKGRMEV